MRKSGAAAAAILMSFFVGVRPASADADKEHRLLLAEIRMLQEEQQQLRAALLNLGDTLKALNTRLDADAGRTQKAFADQKLIVEGVAAIQAGSNPRIVAQKLQSLLPAQEQLKEAA